MKNKSTLPAIALATIILMSQIVLPVHATMMPKTTISSTINIIEIEEYEFTVTVKRYDVFQHFQHFISFEATCEIDGTLFMNVSTDRYPAHLLLTKRDRDPAFLSPNLKINDISEASIPSEWKYTWDDILFVKAPGPPTTYIKYDHPDNYDTYRQGEINVEYTLNGNTRFHHHIAQWRIEEAKEAGTITTIIGALMAVVAAALVIPEPVISKVVAGVVALIAAILAAAGIVIEWFFNDIVQSELGDGWSWTWDFGRWWVFRWWRQSFGAWRDWGWFFVVADLTSVIDYIPIIPRFGGGGGLRVYVL